MKKLFTVILAMLQTVTWWGGSAAEEKQTEFQSGDYNYVLLEDGTAEITDYRGETSSLVIPDTLDGYTVTSIGAWAFDECESLSSVTIGMAVEHIGANPFADCESLTKIVVSPDHQFLATIDQVLFHKLDKRLICCPAGLWAFEYMVPDGIQSIGDGAFSGCKRVDNVMLPDSVTSIGDWAF
ncbi:MAG: leucine-rich repeat domain-containing protein, partial [Chloroflexi bacterium]|nr:leucine-rich repeat domain-containing protein [Chloroflexota bacterium]